jgi:hypothetical protein
MVIRLFYGELVLKIMVYESCHLMMARKQKARKKGTRILTGIRN